jgi:protocatechuate 3,4-dioxygenase alpha subunit
MSDLIYTPSQTVGPFYSTGLLWEGCTDAVAASDPDAIEIRGTVADGDGPFVYPDGMIEFSAGDQFARAQTDHDGHYRVRVRRPRGAPALDDGQAQAPHLCVAIFGRGLLKPLLTRMYFPEQEAANAADPVLSLVPSDRRASLIAEPEADGGLRFDVWVQGPYEGVFFSL